MSRRETRSMVHKKKNDENPREVSKGLAQDENMENMGQASQMNDTVSNISKTNRSVSRSHTGTGQTARSVAGAALAKRRAELVAAQKLAEADLEQTELEEEAAMKVQEAAKREQEAAERTRQAELARIAKMVESKKILAQKELQVHLAEIDLELQEDRSVASSSRVRDWLEEERSGEGFNHCEGRQQLEKPVQKTRVPSIRKHGQTPQTSQVLAEGAGTSTCNKDIHFLAREIANLRRPTEYEIPTFSGNPYEWLAFKAAFEDTKSDLTETQNIARLRRSLKGEGREAVIALLHTQVQSNVIMEALERRFGRAEIIIEQQVRVLKELPKLSDSTEHLSKFACKVQNCVAIIQALNKPTYLNDRELSQAIKAKIPNLKSQWLVYATEQKPVDKPELVKLSDFLNKEADKATEFWLTDANKIFSIGNSKINNYKICCANFLCCDCELVVEDYDEDLCEKCNATNEHGFVTDSGTTSCPYCKSDDHKHLRHCEKFKELDTNARWEWAKNSKICFKCLISKHRRENCRAKRCGVNGCRVQHHRLLHTPRPQTSQHCSMPTAIESKPACIMTEATDPTTGVSAKVEIAACGGDTLHKRAVLQMIKITLHGPKGNCDTYALLDGGSSLTLLKSDLAEKIGCSGTREPLVLSGINATSINHDSQRVNLTITGPSGIELELLGARTVKNLPLSPQTITELDKYEHLKDLPLDILCHENAQPEVLIGQDNWSIMVAKEIRSGKLTDPVATFTPLGWVIHGFASSATNVVNFVGHADEELTKTVEEYFRIDSLGISNDKKTHPDDDRAINILTTTARRVDYNGPRWEVGLLWKDDEPVMPESYKNAKKRFNIIEKKMARDPMFKEKYVANMKNFIDSGYAGPCEPTNSPKKFLLPHFGVTNVNKPGKLRIVFDAASRTNGTSLNEKLLTGPDLLNSLLEILFKFREGKVAMSADIKEMFLQVKVRPDDRTAQRFLWRGTNGEGDINEYEMRSVIFGAACSPTTAIFIKNRNADDFAAEYPESVQAIKTRFYMDDYLHSVDTEEEALKYMQEVSMINMRGGFVLTQWTSNSTTVMRAVEPEKRGCDALDLNFKTNVKTLGLRWNTQDDSLGYNLNTPKSHDDVISLGKRPIKREMLAIIMSVFDPLGLLAPILIQGKVLMQQVWRSGIDWDQQLAEEEFALWTEWLKKLQQSWTCRVPRCYDSQVRDSEVELHIFCDASEKAYAAVGYWRFKHTDGTIRVTLICSKARVTPLKPLSIPRLELQAALIGARLAHTIIRDHDKIQPKRRYFWSDSSTVIAWLRGDPRNYKAYVAHRVGEIAELTKTEEWKWIPTTLNVADDATRNITRLDTSCRWFCGPEFLYLHKTLWPQKMQDTPPPNYDAMEIKLQNETVAVSDVTLQPVLPSIDRFSSWLKLIRSTAHVLLFVEILRHKHSDKSLALSHLSHAEILWTIQSQKESHAADLTHLHNKGCLDRNSRLRKLNPFLDEHGVMRLGGRINVISGLNDDMKHPTILDGKNQYTRLLVLHHHRLNGHANSETVVNLLRQRYWILQLRPTVRAIVHSCQLCRIRMAQPQRPPTGDLPPGRLAHHERPFTHCGWDYFGPMIVAIGRRREKRYGALFTCLTTRAVHLELAASLTTDSAIMALRRFMSRRGSPTVLYSDNGTNFRGADTELRRALSELDDQVVKDFLLNRGVAWKFIPPSSPHMGGCWERMVRSVKKALSATLKEEAPREEVLLTLLAEAEHSINSRPLTHVSVDHEDQEALTPNHFLLGSSSGVSLPGHFLSSDLFGRKQWRRSQLLADKFWRRWIKEYLPTLLPRTTPGDKKPDLKIGDLVVIFDSSLPRNVWPRGIVEKTFPGPDGRVRVAEVRTAAGSRMRRPAVKLVRLPTDEERPCALGGAC